MDQFEGYIGIHLWEGQQVNDILFLFLLTLFVSFAIVFRAYHRLFFKMLRDTLFIRKRQSLFEGSFNSRIGGEWVFRNFMIIQALALSCIALFVIGKNDRSITYLNTSDVLLHIGWIAALIVSFYCLRKASYYVLGNVFGDESSYKLWKISYNAIMGAWGVLLYLPVIWLVFVESQQTAAIVLSVILYILCRFVIIYKTIRIFHVKKNGFLYIILYLCAQEILPLFFLYKGISYLYNFIEVNTLWH